MSTPDENKLDTGNYVQTEKFKQLPFVELDSRGYRFLCQDGGYSIYNSPAGVGTFYALIPGETKATQVRIKPLFNRRNHRTERVRAKK